MDINDRGFEIYLTILRFVIFKVTDNLKRIYLDIDFENNEIVLVAFYLETPSELELELFDDICTNSKAHIPDFIVKGKAKRVVEYNNENHDFVVFSVYKEFGEMLK